MWTNSEFHKTKVTLSATDTLPSYPVAAELNAGRAASCTCTRLIQVEVIEKGESERRAVDDKKRKEEVDFLKYQGQHLDSFLKQIGGSK